MEDRDAIENRKGKSHLTPTDKFFAKFILPVVPRWLRPNAVTVFRFYCIPFVVYFFLKEDYFWGIIIFSIAAFSDALDGAMARVRHQITAFGKFYDPMADKLLIGLAAVILITRYISVVLTGSIIALELFVMGAALYKKWKNPGLDIQARLPGKIKMVLQCVGVIVLLFFLLFHMHWLLVFAEIILWAAVCFAVASLFSYNSI